MNDEELYETIRDRGVLESADAAREAAKAVLWTLGERIAHGRAESLAEGLPDELAGAVASPGGDAEPFGPDEFVSRGAERADGGDQDATERHVQAVFETLGERVNRREWRAVREQLSEDYGPLNEVTAEA